MIGREPTATSEEQETAENRLNEIQKLTNEFILRRTNDLLASVLPPKMIFVRSFVIYASLIAIRNNAWNPLRLLISGCILQSNRCTTPTVRKDSFVNFVFGSYQRKEWKTSVVTYSGDAKLMYSTRSCEFPNGPHTPLRASFPSSTL